jgi:N-alpha-acetyltransferase 50
MSKPLACAQSSILSFLQPQSQSYTTPSIENLNDSSIGTAISTLESFSLPAPLKSLPTATLPSQASILPICEKHLQPLRRINTLLLPVNYPDSFYRKILDPSSPPNFSRVILWNDATPKFDPLSTTEPKVVGGIVCRLEQHATSQTSAIYIQSLVLLSPYRSYGLATTALNAIIQSVFSVSQTTFPVTSVYAHVWSENKDGLDWYSARGFKREEPMIQDYYRKLIPNSAWIVRKAIGPKDCLQYKQPSVIASISDQRNSSTNIVQDHSPTNLSTVLSPRHNPTQVPRATSYQTTGPDREWNDLPDDILLKPSVSNPSLWQDPHLKTPSPADSVATSRSSSQAPSGKKKKRTYPAAAFTGGSASRAS